MSLARNLESLLFVAAKPLTIKKLATLVDAQPGEVAEAVEELKQQFNRDDRGIHLQQMGEQVQLVSSPLAAKLVHDYVQDELKGDLSDPAIETLTIIAYRGPITKFELDQIRGVNCSLILRHLMIKGLVDAAEDKAALTTRYSVTLDFLRFLGLTSVAQLPDFEMLRNDENLKTLLGEDLTAATVDGAKGDGAHREATPAAESAETDSESSDDTEDDEDDDDDDDDV